MPSNLLNSVQTNNASSLVVALIEGHVLNLAPSNFGGAFFILYQENHMPIAIISPPEAKPVSLVQIKRHLRLDHAEDDEYLLELSQAATLHVEAVVGQFLITRTVRQYIDDIPASRSTCLEVWPIKLIQEVRGYDIYGNPNVILAENYRLDNRIEPAALVLNANVNFNAFCNGIEVDMIVGYGETGIDVPSNISRAILVLIAHWYEFRGTLAAGDETALIPEGLNALLAPVKKVRL